MAIKKITEKLLLGTRAEAGKRVELWDEQTPGLCLRVSANRPKDPDVLPTQSRAWVWRYRTLDGRQPRLKLADYSDKHGLKWARLEVEEWRVRIRKGEDPAGKRRADKAKARAEPLKTFNELADSFLTASEKGHWKPRRKQKRPRTIDDERAGLNRYVRPVIGDLRLERIDRRTIKALLNGMIDRGIGAQTNRTHAIIRQVFAYALAEERLTINPALGIDKPATETPRARTLSDDELKALWSICTNCPAEMRAPAKEGENDGRKLYVGRGLRIALQLVMLLLVRRNEVAGMATAELNLEQGTWLIPAERMKGGAPHLVPLPAKAVELIKEAMNLAKGDSDDQPAFVFPSPRGAEKPIRPDAITHAMANLCAVLGIGDASPHDLRRTASTALTSERLGVSPFIRSKILSHTADAGGGAVVSMAHYDANNYLAEKRRALEAWEGLLLEITGERVRPSNVARFPEAAA